MDSPFRPLVFKHSYGDESYGLVYHNRLDGQYEVYEIPMYGGKERLEGIFPADQEAKAIALAKSFT